MAMKNYAISAELKRPVFTTGQLRLDGPLIRAFLSLGQVDMLRFRPPAGVRTRRIRYPAADGTLLDCRVVEPARAPDSAPCLLYLHGGGFIFPLAAMMLRLAGAYAQGAGVRVILPEYRLAPRHPFPFPVEDCYAALRWIAASHEALGIDPQRIAVLGESAGGCLAAAISLMARDRGGPKSRAQLLVYPVTDRSQSGESLRTCPDGVWSTEANRQMWDLYLRNGDLGMTGYASPFLADDLRGLPPAYIELAEFDCLRSEGEAFARRLEAAGCAVETHLVPGTYHGWDMDLGSPLVQRVIERRVAVMIAALGTVATAAVPQA